jgi:hypothetical protein
MGRALGELGGGALRAGVCVCVCVCVRVSALSCVNVVFIVVHVCVSW